MSYVIWLTGVSGAGKTTLAKLVKKELDKKYPKVELLDGDIVRSFFENDLGYTRHERILNIRRITFAAMLLAKHGIPVVVANIAPYYEVRDFIRKKISSYYQIYLEVSEETVVKRDVKGFYKDFREGKIKEMIGMDDPYETPRNPHLKINTEKESVDDSLEKIIDFLTQKGI